MNRFGVISLILTIYRYIPYIYNPVYEYFHDGDSYISLISLNLVFNIICLLYVKLILNESKQKVIVNTLENGSGSIKSEVQSISDGKAPRKHTKRRQLAKAFSLDVIWDYILIVFKKRIQTGRLIIIIFLAIVLVDKTSPYNERFTLELYNKSIDIIDIDGAIFVIISITMLLSKTSDVVIAVLVIGIPIAARLVMVTLGFSVVAVLAVSDIEVTDIIDLHIDSSATDFYSPFKRIAACSLLFAYVDKNESRIFLIVQAIAYLPKAVFKILTKEDDATVITLLDLYVDFYDIDFVAPIIIFVLPLLVFCGLGLLYTFVRKYEKFKNEQTSPRKTIEPITENTCDPCSLIEPVNFQNSNESDKNQLVIPERLFEYNENSTDL